jgi:hypothetical protein
VWVPIPTPLATVLARRVSIMQESLSAGRGTTLLDSSTGKNIISELVIPDHADLIVNDALIINYRSMQWTRF